MLRGMSFYRSNTAVISEPRLHLEVENLQGMSVKVFVRGEYGIVEEKLFHIIIGRLLDTSDFSSITPRF